MTFQKPQGTFDVKAKGAKLVTAPNTFRVAGPGLTFDEVVNKRDVITLDGIPRDVMVINGRHPGPTIEVMEGAQVSCTRCS